MALSPDFGRNIYRGLDIAKKVVPPLAAAAVLFTVKHDGNGSNGRKNGKIPKWDDDALFRKVALEGQVADKDAVPAASQIPALASELGITDIDGARPALFVETEEANALHGKRVEQARATQRLKKALRDLGAAASAKIATSE